MAREKHSESQSRKPGGRSMSGNGNGTIPPNQSIGFHLKEVLGGKRRFETAAQGVSRMILEKGVLKVSRGGRTVYDYPFFRQGKKHIVGWYEEINEFVSFVQEAARCGSSAEQAFVLVGEPGNGKSFFVGYVCARYREFLALPENRKYTFKFVGLDEALGYDEKTAELHSLTFEDPMILAMNLFENQEDSKKFLSRYGFDENAIEELYARRRPMGASTEYLWWELMSRYGGDVEKALEHVKITPVPMRESLGTTTGKYSAKDKITSSSVDLLGEESLQHLILLKLGDPNKFDLTRGALARVAGSGIHFSDELFKNKPDLVNIYLQVIQNRQIEVDAFIWPIDTLIIATSNNWEFNRFVAEKEQGPIKDRCRICYVSHNTDYKLQSELTAYIIGGEKRTTVTGENLHEDPNLNYALSTAVVLTRLPHSAKLTPVDTMKLEAGDIAGEKSVRTLREIKDSLNASQDVTKRWGQKGIGHRGEGRIVQRMLAMSETHEGKCLFARDVFKAAEREIIDYVAEAVDREKFIKDLRVASKLYREHIKTSVFNAYRDDPDAIRKEVMAYVNMIIGIDSDQLGPEKIWRYRDPQTRKMKAIKIDRSYINSVETRLGLNSKEQRETFRTTIRKIYVQKVPTKPDYDFMDSEALVKAVIDFRLESDVAEAGSVVGALANQTDKGNIQLRNRMVGTMFGKLGYCKTCAEKTIEYFCEKVDES